MLYELLRRILAPLFRLPIKKIRGLDHLPVEGGYLIAANHIDYLDGFFITMAVMQRRPRMVKFLAETKNYWWTGGATIPIDPNNKAESLERSLMALREKNVVCIFPEGQRNIRNILCPGKTGIARLALASGLPIIPIGILGPSGNNFGESLRLLFRKTHTVELVIGEPLIFQPPVSGNITKELLIAHTREIMIHIGQLCGKRYTA